MIAKSVQYVLLGTALVLGLAMPAQAQLSAVGPVDSVTGFPIWFEDASGLRVQLCDEFDPEGVLEEQAPCLPELIDPNGGFVDGNIGEALYFAVDGETTVEDTGEFIRAQCVLEAAGPELPGDTNTVANAALIRIRFLTIPGDYEVVTPCATFNFTFPFADDPDGNEFRAEIVVEGLPTDDPPFSGALGLDNPDTPVHFFASNGTGAPGFLGNGGDPLEGDVGPLSNQLNPNFDPIVTASLNGEVIATITDFVVVGKLSGCTEENEAPIAVDDWVGTTAGEAVIIDVLANDSDIVVQFDEVGDPTLVTVTPPLGTVEIVADSIAPAGSGTVEVNAANTVTFTPAGDFTGPAIFAYTVTDPCGLISAPATVTVLVEDMEFRQADYRTRTGTWTLAGGGNIPDLSFEIEEGVTAFYTTLTSAQEVPPRTSAGRGEAIVTLRELELETVIDYTLTYSGLAAVTQSHIHNGGVGVNGPVNVFLCTNLGLPETFPVTAQVPPACPTTAGTVTGTLTVDDFIAAGAVETFEELLAAIDAGGTYVNVHTEAFPPGEIRGQVGVNVISLRAGTDGPAIGAVPVELSGDWNFSGKVNLAPTEASEGVRSESAAGVSATRQLRLR